jgi:ribonuclease P protein component
MSSTAPRLLFPKTQRLILTSQFARVRSEGESIRGRTLILGFLRTEGPNCSQAGVVTSKRIGGAVVRNRVRRRVRDIIRTEQGRLRKGYWFVVIARPPAARASYRALKDEWLRLAERASILAP